MLLNGGPIVWNCPLEDVDLLDEGLPYTLNLRVFDIVH